MDDGGVPRDGRYRNRSRLVKKHEVGALVSFTLLFFYDCDVTVHISEGTKRLSFAFCLFLTLVFCRIWSRRAESGSGFIPDRCAPSLAAVSLSGVLGWRLRCADQ